MAMTKQPCMVNYHPYVPPINTHRRHHRTRQLLSSAGSNESFIEPRTIHEVTIELPLGVVLEDMDPSPSSTNTAPSGVTIIGIHKNGNAAIYNTNIFSKLKSPRTENTYNISCHNDCICIRDKIMSINGVPCHDMGFDEVIKLISKSATNNSGNKKITIGLGRLMKSTVVNYHSGIAISAKPGESYGFLAAKCGIDSIEYECRSGNCQTCMRWMEFPDKQIVADDKAAEAEETSNNSMRGKNIYRRTIMHCVGKVPRGYDWLHVMQ